MRKYTAWALALCVSMVAVAQAAENDARLKAVQRGIQQAQPAR